MTRYLLSKKVTVNLRYIALLISVPLIFACSLSLPDSTPPAPATTATMPLATETPANATAVASPTPSKTAIPIITITGNVRVRTLDGSDTGAVLLLGDTVQAFCDVDYCYIVSGEHTGYKIWRGCTSEANRGCESR